MQDAHVSATQPEETRRSSRDKRPPLWMKDVVSHAKHTPYSLDKYISYDKVSKSYQAYLSRIPVNTEPKSYKEAITEPKWIEAMKAEIESSKANHTWDVVTPQGKIPIGCKWIYKIKYKSSGEFERYKARLVAKGYSQKEGIDYQETFSPVVMMKIVRIILNIASQKKWHIHQMDVFNAFR